MEEGGTVKISGTKELIQAIIDCLEKDFHLFGPSGYRVNADGSGYHRFVQIIMKEVER